MCSLAVICTYRNGKDGTNMKKKLSYDEEMTLLLELTDSMDEGDRECFTL